jgi:hypothetical protein
MVTPPSSAGIIAQDPTSPSPISPTVNPQLDEDQLSHFFVVDSFNIHRLVIAGVTCASKFFSDVFYTNSRYAKVFFRHSDSELWLMIEITGRRPSPSGIKPFRTPVPSIKRLSPFDTCRGIRSIWNHARGVLRP